MTGLGIKEYLFGYALIELPIDKKSELIDLFIKSKVIFKTCGTDNEKSVIIVSGREVKYIKKLTGEAFSELKIKYGGLPNLFLRYKSRPGILAGCVLALLTVGYFSLLVWNIDIIGNENISDAYILKKLDDYGLRVGVMRARVDIDKLTQSIMIEDGRIGWLSVNFRGTNAYVEVIEYSAPGEKSAKNEARNIIAKRDGRVLEIDVYEGVPAAEIGDSVKAGDLLIGGVSDSSDSGYKLKRADGSVIAEVMDTFRIEIPYEYTQNVYTGNTMRQKTLNFLGHEIKLFKNSGNVYDKCDIIESVRRVELFDKIKLPLEISEKTYNEYEEKSFTLTKEAAADLACSELEEKLSKLATDSDVLQKKIDARALENSFVIDAVIYHTENICEARPISVSKQSATEENN